MARICLWSILLIASTWALSPLLVSPCEPAHYDLPGCGHEWPHFWGKLILAGLCIGVGLRLSKERHESPRRNLG